MGWVRGVCMAPETSTRSAPRPLLPPCSAPLLAPTWAEDSVCSHLKAAAQVTGGFTPALRTAAADHLVATAQICVDEALGCHCMALANPLRPVLCVPLEGACTCHDRAMHGTCCHLLAAARLPEFHGVELPSGPPVPDDNLVRKQGCEAGGGEGVSWHEQAHALLPCRTPCALPPPPPTLHPWQA